MLLTNNQLASYNKKGFLLVKNVFSESEIKLMLDEFYSLAAEDIPGKILENNGDIRSIFVESDTTEVVNKVIRHPRLLNPARQILKSEVYAHQIKINSKLANGGERWQWHQDFVYWHLEDGMPEPRAVSMAIFLKDVTEFNGPLFLVPGSHNIGMFDTEPNDVQSPNNEKFMSTLTSNLKYTIKNETLQEVIKKNGIVSGKGSAGSVLFFDANIFHASSENLSPWHRILFFVTYNSVENKLKAVENPRPDYIASRNFDPLLPLADDSLIDEVLAKEVEESL